MERRTSKQRELILQAVRNSDFHPTAEEVYKALNEEHPSLSLGTVYRNLNLLAQWGEIARLDLGGESANFDRRCDEHAHFVCSACKRIFDLDLSMEPVSSAFQASYPEHSLSRASLLYEGICGGCLKAGRSGGSET